MIMDINAIVHRTDEVGSNRIDQAESALNDLGSQLDHSISTRSGAYLDNSEAPGKVDADVRRQWLNYVEDTLHNDNYLGDATVHIILYHKSLDWDGSHGGAGFHEFRAGKKNSGRLLNNRDYSSSDGQYAFANVNTTTGNYPYTQKIFEMTVMHEAGHTIGAHHKHGSIESQYSSGSLNYFVSPMLTWYAEQPCVAFPTDNSRLDTICYNDKDTNSACNHHRNISSTSCNQGTSYKPTSKKINNHVSNYSESIK